MSDQTSIDPAIPQGGELVYFTPKGMPIVFSREAAAMLDEQYATAGPEYCGCGEGPMLSHMKASGPTYWCDGRCRK